MSTDRRLARLLELRERRLRQAAATLASSRIGQHEAQRHAERLIEDDQRHRRHQRELEERVLNDPARSSLDVGAIEQLNRALDEHDQSRRQIDQALVENGEKRQRLEQECAENAREQHRRRRARDKIGTLLERRRHDHATRRRRRQESAEEEAAQARMRGEPQ
ncbi:hypothetical protein [Halotalea alkalilenta]|uniref:Type III secretion protein n=1 Tax=Halotalea alkalilenta TaxID=376489 RepID=A0A172YHV8_9GAMM|nr:hypothetical protein [Halotalea alkalilenta]ANF58746.1 hypothetical protein A5892_15775 [Halotalea alkalilenta]